MYFKKANMISMDETLKQLHSDYESRVSNNYGLKVKDLQIFALDTTVKKVSYKISVGFYGTSLLAYDAVSGYIYRWKNTRSYEIIEVIVEDTSVWVVLKSGDLNVKAQLTIADGHLMKGWEIAGSNKKSQSNCYLYTTLCSKEFGKLILANHHIASIFEYGYAITRLCLGSGSPLTVDHINSDTYNNSLSNLRIVTRGDNIRLAKIENFYAIDFTPYHFTKAA